MGVERGGDRDALNALLHLFLKVTASEPLFCGVLYNLRRRARERREG